MIGPGSYGISQRSSTATTSPAQNPSQQTSLRDRILEIVGRNYFHDEDPGVAQTPEDRFFDFLAISSIQLPADEPVNERAVLDFFRNYRQHLTPANEITEAQKLFVNLQIKRARRF
jgi:hypothetical protein